MMLLFAIDGAIPQSSATGIDIAERGNNVVLRIDVNASMLLLATRRRASCAVVRLPEGRIVSAFDTVLVPETIDKREVVEPSLLDMMLPGLLAEEYRESDTLERDDSLVGSDDRMIISSDAPPSAQKEKSSQSNTVGVMERTDVAIRVEDAVVEAYVARDVVDIGGAMIPKGAGRDADIWKAS